MVWGCLNKLSRERIMRKFRFPVECILNREEVTSSGFGENVHCSCKHGIYAALWA